MIDDSPAGEDVLDEPNNEEIEWDELEKPTNDPDDIISTSLDFVQLDNLAINPELAINPIIVPDLNDNPFDYAKGAYTSTFSTNELAGSAEN